MGKKRVYTFGNGKAEGKADMKNLLGGKGANLAEMNLIGVPVPPGFTITTEVCTEYYDRSRLDFQLIMRKIVQIMRIIPSEGAADSRFFILFRFALPDDNISCNWRSLLCIIMFSGVS